MAGPKKDSGKASMEAASQVTAPVIEKEESNQSFVANILLIVIVLLLVALPVLVSKFNIAGIGEKLRPVLEDIPYISMILPKKPDPQDPKYMSKGELTKGFLEYKAQAEKLQKQLEDANNELQSLSPFKEENQKMVDEQNRLNQERQQLEQDKQQLEADRQKYNEQTAVKNQEQAEKDIKDIIAMYENAEAESTAKAFEKMKVEDVVLILKAMKKSQAGEIFSAMNPEFSAKVGESFSKQYFKQP